MHSTRLQGNDWYECRKKHKLTLLCLSTSKAGNYRADVMDENGWHYHHWLHPIEAKKLKNSGYLDNHLVVDSNELKSKGFMKRIWAGEAIVNI